MAGIQDFVIFEDDFLGAKAITAVGAEGQPWEATYAAGGTTTIGGINGELTIANAVATEIQNNCVAFEDDLNFDIDLLDHIEMRVKAGQAALNATSMLAFGLCSARNDVIDSLTAHASFRVIGATTTVFCETDDGDNDNDDVSTGLSLVATYRKFVISFAGGTSDVRFFIDGQRVCASTTFDMSSYTAGLQPYMQIQKTSDANVDAFVIDYVRIVSRRA